MNILPNLTAVGDALGWAVLHSLWQGALAALLVWGFRTVTRENAADTRYMFEFLTLSALFAAFVGTFIYYFNVGVANLPMAALPAETTTVDMPALLPASDNPLLNLTNHTSTIGAIWAACFLVLAIRYLAAFRLTHKLRTSGTSPLPSNWQTRFVTLAEQSGVNGKVRGFISEHVASPVTFGFFKPIVLVPAWFFTGMTAEQCEAVLLHELAHIRRHDFLTNIFQIIIRTVFFYHPAVQYICKHINTDREHACDDFAVNMTHNPESLATALGTIRLKAARNAGVFAQVGILGADGPDAPIMHRLKRLMGVSTTVRTNGTARGFAATGMIVLTAGLVLTLGASQSIAHPVTPEELAGKKESKINITGDGYKIVGNIYYLKKNGTYASGTKMSDAYSYAFETRNGKTFAIKTDANGRKTFENGKPYLPAKKEQKFYNTADFVQVNGQDYLKIDGKKYKIKTKIKGSKKQTYININGNWHDLDETDLDAILPTPPFTPVPPVNGIAPLAPLVPLSTKTSFSESTSSSHSTPSPANWENTSRKAQKEWEKDQREAAKDWREEQKELEADQREMRRDQEQQHKASAKRIEKMANKEAKAREMGKSKLARELAEDRRELEQEHRELVQEHHEEIREWEGELREAKLEWKQEQREARLEYTAEKRERSERSRQRARDQEQRTRNEQQQRRDARQNERDTEQRVRDQKQRARDKNRKKEDIKRQANYETMRNKLIPILIADGFIKSEKQRVIIDITDENTIINGRKLTENEHDKYCPIVSKYFKREGHTKFIKFKPGFMHVSAKDDEGHSYSYTHTE